MAIQMQERKRGRDKDEVRLENPVPKLLERYGVKTRGNRYVPFCHNADQYSGIMDDESCYCFVCNRTFDCFSIVGFFEAIEDFDEQVAFLGGEELPEDNPRRKELKKRAQELKLAKEAEEAARKVKTKSIIEKTDEMYRLRDFLRRNKPENGSWPSKEWAEAYTKFQRLHYEVSCLLEDNIDGNMDCFPDLKF